MAEVINIKIGGKAGEGIKSAGLILSKSLTRLGFSVFAYDEYPSLIRGGHNTYQVFFSSEQVYSQHKTVDILIALDEKTYKEHQKELKEGGVVLYDSTIFTPKPLPLIKLLEIPWAKLSEEGATSRITSNMVALGAVFALLDLPLNSLLNVIADTFKEKGEDVILGNKKAVLAGEGYVKDWPKINITKSLLLSKVHRQMVLSGNEAVALGAVSAGLKYFASYPMTPTSSILHVLADFAEKHRIVVHHVENEIAAVNSLIGASAAGIRVMTATSGGGFALMAEGLGMAGVAEVPLVVVLGVRPGPATGMPTWTGQGDLRFALHASQDEFPRVIFTPGDIKETFFLTRKAFMIAEKYQLPVIILIDKYLGEGLQNIPLLPGIYNNERFSISPPIKNNFQRYQITGSGVSSRPLLGQNRGASLFANSYEHDIEGFSAEDGLERIQQVKKRFQKLKDLSSDLEKIPLFGPKNAPITLVGFGSTLGPVREGLKELPDVNYLHFNYLWPFPTSAKEILKQAKKVICLEGNYEGQLAGLINQQTGIKIEENFNKYDGRPFYPEEIMEFVKRGKN